MLANAFENLYRARPAQHHQTGNDSSNQSWNLGGATGVMHTDGRRDGLFDVSQIDDALAQDRRLDLTEFRIRRLNGRNRRRLVPSAESCQPIEAQGYLQPESGRGDIN
jgi:hypothetical protein